VYPAVLLKNFMSIDVSRFLSFCLRVQISLPCRRMGRLNVLYTSLVQDLWVRVCLKVLFKIPSI
jgi:hypothetical protein